LAGLHDARSLAILQKCRQPPGSAGPQAAPHERLERQRAATKSQVLAPYCAKYLSLALDHLLAARTEPEGDSSSCCRCPLSSQYWRQDRGKWARTHWSCATRIPLQSDRRTVR